MDRSQTFEQFLSVTSPEISLIGFFVNLLVTAFFSPNFVCGLRKIW